MRCFIALEVGEDVKQHCRSHIAALKKSGFHGKWVENENFHITLFFLGEISEEQMKKTAEIVKNSRFNHFSLWINQLGFFQKYGKPTVIWLGFQKSDPLQELYSVMKNELEAIGYQGLNKRYIPHLTLGRIKKFPEDWEDKLKSMRINNVTITDTVLSLKRSTLTENGPIYKVLETTKF